MNRILVAFIVVLICLNIYLIYQKRQNEKAYAEVLNRPTKVMSDKLHALNERVVRDGHSSSGYQLSKRIILTDISGQELDFDRLIGDTHDALFFRFSPSIHCQSCVNESIGALSKFYNKNRNGKIFILATEASANDLKVITAKFGLLMPIYAIQKSYFPKELEDREEPFFFVTDKSHFITNVFTVHYELAYLVPKYLSAIEQ